MVPERSFSVPELSSVMGKGMNSVAATHRPGHCHLRPASWTHSSMARAWMRSRAMDRS